jgi:hypothetical protein
MLAHQAVLTHPKVGTSTVVLDKVLFVQPQARCGRRCWPTRPC